MKSKNVSRVSVQQDDTQSLLDKVLGLYSRYGIRSVTMDDISRELGISKKTIYQHITDKHDLVKRVVAFESELSKDLLQSSHQEGLNAIDQLIKVNQLIHSGRTPHNPAFYYDLRKYYPDIFRSWMTEKRIRMQTLIESNMLKGKQEGLYRIDLNHKIIAKLYMARIEMLDHTDILTEPETKSLDFIREVFIYHLHGICNAKGLDYLSGQENRI